MQRENSGEHQRNGLPPQYVNAQQVLDLLFAEGARPSLRWLRDQQKRRSIPFVKIGHLVRFDPAAVRAALDGSRTVRSKAARTSTTA